MESLTAVCCRGTRAFIRRLTGGETLQMAASGVFAYDENVLDMLTSDEDDVLKNIMWMINN